MKKIMELTNEQFEQFMQAENKVVAFKALHDIPKSVYRSGTTTIYADNAKKGDVYEVVLSDRHYYYVVDEPTLSGLATAISIYPIY